MGKNRKNAEKGGERKLVSWESGRNIPVSLLYLAAEGCGQKYNECIPTGLQDRVKLTPRSSRQVEGWTGTGPGRREPACLNKAPSTDCSQQAWPSPASAPRGCSLALSRCWARFVSFLGSLSVSITPSLQLGDSWELLCPSQLSPGQPQPGLPPAPSPSASPNP